MGGTRWKQAVRYANHGLKVHPLKPGEKVPLLPRWQKRATDNKEKVEGWFKQFGRDGQEPNIGIATGHGSGVVVLDVDGEKGEQSLEDLTQGKSLPPTVLCLTPNGKHYYFAYDQTTHGDLSNRQGFREGLDFRSDGGYVVAPGSEVEGEKYEWNPMLGPFTQTPAEIPGWLLDEVKTNNGSGSSSKNEGQTTSNDYKSVEDYATEEIPEKVEGELLCPLLKKSEKFDTNPPEKWCADPGQRHRFLLEKAMTHFNLGLSRDYLEAVFFKKVWPSMDRGPGHDGKSFTAREFHEIVEWAEDNVEGKAPENVVAFHQYHNKRTKGKPNRGQSRGKTRWRGTKLWAALSAFMEKKGEVRCHTQIENKESYEVLAEKLHEWAKKKTDNSNPIPIRSLKRWVKRLVSWGVLEKNVDREGTGHVGFSLVFASSNGSPMPSPRTKRGLAPYQGETLHARENRDPEEPPKDPPDREESTQNPVEMIRNSTLTVPYPRLGHYLDNVSRTERKNKKGPRTPHHIVAWMTGDIEFACWIYRHVGKGGLWEVLREYEQHHEDIESPGGWLRQRVRNRFESCKAV